MFLRCFTSLCRHKNSDNYSKCLSQLTISRQRLRFGTSVFISWQCNMCRPMQSNVANKLACCLLFPSQTTVQSELVLFFDLRLFARLQTTSPTPTTLVMSLIMPQVGISTHWCRSQVIKLSASTGWTKISDVNLVFFLFPLAAIAEKKQGTAVLDVLPPTAPSYQQNDTMCPFSVTLLYVFQKGHRCLVRK